MWCSLLGLDLSDALVIHIKFQEQEKNRMKGKGKTKTEITNNYAYCIVNKLEYVL